MTVALWTDRLLFWSIIFEAKKVWTRSRSPIRCHPRGLGLSLAHECSLGLRQAWAAGLVDVVAELLVCEVLLALGGHPAAVAT